MKIILKNDHFLLVTKDKKVLNYFKYNKSIKVWSNRTKRFISKDAKVNIYKRIKKDHYSIPKGFIFYTINVLGDKLKSSDVKEIVNEFKSEEFEWDYQRLYPNQIEDLKVLLKYKMGVFQCHTGYGKTEVIATLCKNFVDRGMKVLVIAPSNQAVTEVRKRIQNYVGPINTYVNKNALINVTNPKALVGNNHWEAMRKSDFTWFRDVDVVIADEVEMTLNKSYYRIKKRLTKAKYFYGFSASANKNSIDPIPRTSDLKRMMNSQIASMVSQYGFTSVYKLPKNNELVITTLHSNLSGYRYINSSKSKSKYSALMSNLFTYPKFQMCIRHILTKVDNLYIPINNLNSIKELIHSDLTDRPVMTIQGSGIHIYKRGKHVKSIGLTEAKKMINDGEIHALFGTITSFRALDFRKLNNILCTFGKLTSVVLQQVGRISREVNMNLWYIESSSTIPIYSKTIKNNKEMIEDFYQHCSIDYAEEFL